MLMVGVLLAGAVGYTQLPVSALPEVDYPIIQVTTFYPGASPDVMASSVTAPLERQLGRKLGDHPAIQPRPEHRRGRAGGAAVDQRLGDVPPGRPACASDLQQDE